MAGRSYSIELIWLEFNKDLIYFPIVLVIIVLSLPFVTISFMVH